MERTKARSEVNYNVSKVASGTVTMDQPRINDDQRPAGIWKRGWDAC